MYHIIYNPISGKKGSAQKNLAIVEKKLKEVGKEYVVHATEYAGHSIKIANELSQTPDTNILVMGGDGSFYEALNGIDKFENITLGLLPCGSGNDFIKASHHPKKLEKALDVILKGNTEYIDFIQMDDRRCINVVGGGMDVDVLEKYASMKHFHGKIRYFIAFLSTILRPTFHKLKITIDGVTTEKSVFMVGVGNGQYIGGSLPITPHGEVQDGLLDVVVVNETKKWIIPFEIPKFLIKRHVYKYYTEEFSTKEVTIEVLDNSRFEADGEIFDNKSIHCKVISNTLKVFK